MELEQAMKRYLALTPLTSKRDRDITAAIQPEVAAAAVGALSAQALYEGVDDAIAMETIKDAFCSAVELYTAEVAKPMGHMPAAEIRDDGHMYVNGERVD